MTLARYLRPRITGPPTKPRLKLSQDWFEESPRTRLEARLRAGVGVEGDPAPAAGEQLNSTQGAAQ